MLNKKPPFNRAQGGFLLIREVYQSKAQSVAEGWIWSRLRQEKEILHCRRKILFSFNGRGGPALILL